MKISKFAELALTGNVVKSLIAIACLFSLSGCLVSPFYGQKFDSRSDEIPFTVYTTNKNNSITIECAQATAHGTPYLGESSYQLVSTIWPATQGMRDTEGNIIYSASTSRVLPSDCYRYYSYADRYDYITVVRVLQNGSDQQIFTFDEAGLACLGQWTGASRTWFNWFSKDCWKKYINTGAPIKTVFLRAGI